MKHDYCVACAKAENLHQHHLVPKSLGGSDDERNLITLCGECHAKIHGNRSKWNTSELTKAALKKKREKGGVLGNIKTLTNENREKAIRTIKKNAEARNLKNKDVIIELHKSGYSCYAIAKKLTNDCIDGKTWQANQVKRILDFFTLD
jgi:hypothetical protein